MCSIISTEGEQLLDYGAITDSETSATAAAANMAQLINLIKSSIFDCETVKFKLNRIVDYLGPRSAAALYKRLDKIEDCLGTGPSLWRHLEETQQQSLR